MAGVMGRATKASQRSEEILCGTIPYMGLLPIELILNRVESARTESPEALFNSLLYLAESLLKTYATAIISGIPDEPNRHRYRLCHKLLRAAGIGEWDDALADVSTGPASQHLLKGAAELQSELIERVGPGTWQFEASSRLHAALREILPDIEPLPTKVDGRRWFTLFVQFRNKTRGHGAPTTAAIQAVVPNLEASVFHYLKHSALTRIPWAYVKRNMSGKYHVASLAGNSPEFDRLKGDRSISVEDGVYLDLGKLCRVELIYTTLDLTEFYYPNGHLRQRQSEWLSYISGTRKDLDCSQYLAPPTALPPSTTGGEVALDVVGNCFANLPPRPLDYVSRDELEKELSSVLCNDRHPIVTLVGRGGIGKTSLALEVLYRIADSLPRFTGIVWLSARDIDLLPHGPKLVRPSALTPRDMATQFASLFQPAGWDKKGFNNEEYLAESLSHSQVDGPLMVVFDNFETVQQPVDVFNWLDSRIRLPNKILITTRHRDFRGDYPVDVGGMTEHQCNELVLKTCGKLGIADRITPEFLKDVYRESEGHPYVAKILVGEAADGKNIHRIERVVATKDDLLDALFERTYKRLSPAAKRIFLTLSNWRSLVPQIALEAALLRPGQVERIDVASAVEELRHVSFVDEPINKQDDRIFLGVPLVAGVFGKRKLSTSPEQSEIEKDTRFLQRFGVTQRSEVRSGLEPRVTRFFSTISEDVSQSKTKLKDDMPVLELIARQYPPAWLKIADLWRESNPADGGEQALEALTRFLESRPSTTEAKVIWEKIAIIRRQRNDWHGFLDAQVQIAELPGVGLEVVSAAVNTFNSVASSLESYSRRTFAQRLVRAMEPKMGIADSTDCSRLAWLLIHCEQEQRALDFVEVGLRLDPSNEYCQRVKLRIWGRRAQSARDARDWAAFLDASLRVAEVPSADFGDLSELANQLNQLGRDWEPDPERRQLAALRLAGMMEARLTDASATDCSRLGWLLLSAGEAQRARRVVEIGLQRDPTNDHCLKLRARLEKT